VTGVSAGSRSAIAGGERQRFERQLFDGAYDGASADSTELPVYGSYDLLFDDHGGSPRFGSSFFVLRRHVLERTTLCVGDSHMGPRDVGTVDEPASILAGLAEQAVRNELLNRDFGVAVLFGTLDGSFRLNRASRDLDGYIEAQIHGGVSLEADVEMVVVDPSFRGTQVGQDLSTAGERYGFAVAWHRGSELHVDEVPADFRGPAMRPLAREVARADGIVDAHAIGVRSSQTRFQPPTAMGDPPDSELQLLKQLWHTLLAFGRDATA
jgi:ribosomal protein S18 acetylase RimI-like enzyme